MTVMGRIYDTWKRVSITGNDCTGVKISIEDAELLYKEIYPHNNELKEFLELKRTALFGITVFWS